VTSACNNICDGVSLVSWRLANLPTFRSLNVRQLHRGMCVAEERGGNEPPKHGKLRGGTDWNKQCYYEHIVLQTGKEFVSVTDLLEDGS